eukprot:TRINITY_DN111815_c0_g1_i1.p1 TRINITY_DN111815_c0_g1~~TRINITY_DN111815_c0_g1_i1.p1  ORF type:complete len:228 (+),score=31.30 TRINITY_DN111815_c0_g1_i1:39-722(+)
MAKLSAAFLLAAAQLVTAFVGPEPPCARHDIAFDDIALENWRVPTGNITVSSLACQQECQRRPSCVVFTWYANSGGCWLQGNYSLLRKETNHSISGPKFCPAAPTYFQAKDVDMQAATSWPWYAWALIALAVVAVVLALIFYCSYTQGTRKRAGSLELDHLEHLRVVQNGNWENRQPSQMFSSAATYTSPRGERPVHAPFPQPAGFPRPVQGAYLPVQPNYFSGYQA